VLRLLGEIAAYPNPLELEQAEGYFRLALGREIGDAPARGPLPRLWLEKAEVALAQWPADLLV
jgi:hypothetical protein